MKPHDVESWLGRFQPGPAPEGLSGRILKEADRATRDTRFSGRFTVAAAALALLATAAWLAGDWFRSRPVVPAQERQGHGFQEGRLHSLPEAHDAGALTWSPDGKHWALVVTSLDGARVVVDGTQGEPFHEIQAPRFGADGRYAYLAQQGDLLKLVVDGQRLQGYNNYDAFAWSPDGRTLAYVAEKEELRHVVSGDRVSPAFMSAGLLTWSPDGRRLAYAARIDRDAFAVVDGEKQEIFDNVSNLTWSPDGKTLAYTAHEGKALVVVGGKKGQEFLAVGPPVFSPDGSTLAHAAKLESGWGWTMVVERDRALVARHKELGPPVFSRDGRTLAYRAVQENGQEAVIVERKNPDPGELSSAWSIEGVEDKEFNRVGNPVVSPDGSRVVYPVAKGNRWYLAVNGALTKKFSFIDGIQFGPDGMTVAYRAGQYGKQLVVAGEAQSAEVDEILSGPVFSPDGTKVAYVALLGREVVTRTLEVK